MSLFTQRVLDEIAVSEPVNGIRIVGVDGPSGSGKSTFADQLAQAVGSQVIRTDDFAAWTDFAGWWPRFERQVIAPLLEGKPAHYQCRDWVNDEFGDSLDAWVTVPWSPIVVIEGATSTRAAAADALAYRIWVEAPSDERLRRGIQRDGEDHRALWLEWMTQEREFFAADGTRDRADFIVPAW